MPALTILQTPKVRISWAFLELCGTEAALSDVTIGVSLGRILATVEQSLHRWEQGECQNPTFTNSLSSDTSVFSSFFGKPRLSSAILEQMISDHDDEDEVELASLLEKSHRPKLRDLSVDPSNLCKAACVFQRLSAKHPHISGGWTLTRVAVRLMASKGARLMKECSIHDIVRLSEAAALSEVDGHGRELITGLFAHKAVQVLNEALDSGRKMGYDSVNIAEASPSEICTLLWALGELGVKHSSYEESRHSAHKKLRMVADVPLLTKDQVNALDVASAIKLVSRHLEEWCRILWHRLTLLPANSQCRGVIRMKYCSSDPIFVVNVLKAVQKKTSNLQGTDDLCALAESISMLKESLKAADTTRHTNIDSNTDENAEQHKDQSFETPVDVTLTPEDDSSIPLDYALVNQELKLSCDAILQSITLQAKETAEKFSSVEIRRLLVVYSFLPFQADDFIDCLDREVSFRLSYQKRSSNASLESLIKNAKSKSVAVNSTIFGDASSSRFGSFKNGILSLFRNSDSSETSDENTEENNLTEELASLIQESIASTSDAAKQAEEFQTASRTSLDSILKRLGEGSSFELGRCQELIESYRRIEFSTGTRRSRYDKERRKDIAKRVLSRLLP